MSLGESLFSSMTGSNFLNFLPIDRFKWLKFLVRITILHHPIRNIVLNRGSIKNIDSASNIGGGGVGRRHWITGKQRFCTLMKSSFFLSSESVSKMSLEGIGRPENKDFERWRMLPYFSSSESVSKISFEGIEWQEDEGFERLWDHSKA